MTALKMQTTPKREYGIDLLKVLAMLSIVAGHIFYRGQAGLTSDVFSGVKGLTYQLVNASIICHVNIFVLCTGWLFCTRDVHCRKLVNFWFLMVFYSLTFIGIAKCFYPAVQITHLTWLAGILPIGFNPYWFITQYVALMFMMPLLNSALRTLSCEIMCRFLRAGFFLFVLYPFILRRDMFGLMDGFSAFWFAYLYLLAGAIKIHGLFSIVKNWYAGIIFVVSVILNVLTLHLHEWLCSRVGITSVSHMWGGYTSPFLVVEGVAIFLIFTRLKITSALLQKVLVMVAPSILSVYLIHSNGVFRQITNWNESWTAFFARASTGWSLLVAVLFSLLIFTSCIIIDLVRRYSLRFIFNHWLRFENFR